MSRIQELPENVIDLLAWQWHVDFYEPELPLETKRALVLDSIRWHRKKGTKAAITDALEKLGFVPTIKEWFKPELQTEPHTFSVRGSHSVMAISAALIASSRFTGKNHVMIN